MGFESIGAVWAAKQRRAVAGPVILPMISRRMLPPLFQAIRPHQWVKNLLVFAPLLFTAQVHSPAAWGQSGLAFAVFCMVASSIYVLNDIVDRDADRRHPKKRHRPIAAGTVSVPAALALFAGMLAVAVVIAIWLGQPPLLAPRGPEDIAPNLPFAAWPAAYFVLNLGYSAWFKHLVVIDCMCIALGFQLRVHAGASALGVPTSNWIVLCTFFFALFLAFCKRYEEVGRQSETTGHTRATMKDYTLPFLNMMIGPLAALSILTYALYTVSPTTVARHHTSNLMFTVPVVTYGVFRYLFLVYRREQGGDPSRLLFRDLPLVLSGLAYVGIVLFVLGRAGG